MIHMLEHNPITRQQILDPAKLKEFADDNFKFDENGRKLSKWVENTVGKGEIARYEQFLLFPQCFQKACFPGASKGVIAWEWVLTGNYVLRIFVGNLEAQTSIEVVRYTYFQNHLALNLSIWYLSSILDLQCLVLTLYQTTKFWPSPN